MQFVRDIMTSTVRTLHRDTALRDVEKAFLRSDISGAPLVDDSGTAVGFISKSDICRFDSTSADPFHARAYEIVNPKVIITEPSATIQEAAKLMLREHVHHLLVTDGPNIVGVLSALDFVRLVAAVPGENPR